MYNSQVKFSVGIGVIYGVAVNSELCGTVEMCSWALTSHTHTHTHTLVYPPPDTLHTPVIVLKALLFNQQATAVSNNKTPHFDRKLYQT